MGSRAGVIVLDGSGRPRVFYDHWAAQSLGVDAALQGIDATLDRVRRMEPVGVQRLEEWASAAWMEGAMLIDFATRTAIWAEEPDNAIPPRVLKHVIEATWPGWTAHWAPESLWGILATLGVDPVPLLAREPPPARRTIADSPWFSPDAADRFMHLPVSVRLADGEVVTWCSDAAIDEVAELGPDEIMALADASRRRTGAGWGVAWVPEGEWPEAGFHMDVRSRTARWWSFTIGDLAVARFRSHWAGWEVTTLGDDFAWHERAVGQAGSVLRPAWPDEVGAERSAFEWMIGLDRSSSPMAHVVDALTAAGHDVEVHPDTAITVPVSQLPCADVVLAETDRLALTSPLPPVTFVSLNRRHRSWR